MTAKKLLAILGSPHPQGATAAMLHCATVTAEKAGWQVETVWLYQKQIGYCTGCRACVATARCIQQDDLQALAAQLKACDAVALAAPTYWANVPAVVKNLFDRLLGVAMEETAHFPKPRLAANQKYLLLTACNTPAPFAWLCGQSRGALRAMKEFFQTSGMHCWGRVVFAKAQGSGQLPPAIEKKIRRYWQ